MYISILLPECRNKKAIKQKSVDYTGLFHFPLKFRGIDSVIRETAPRLFLIALSPSCIDEEIAYKEAVSAFRLVHDMLPEACTTRIEQISCDTYRFYHLGVRIILNLDFDLPF